MTNSNAELHDRIWLEAPPGADEEYGQQWHYRNVWGEDAIEYVRADIAIAPQAPVGYRWRGIGEWFFGTRAPDGVNAEALYLASPPPPAQADDGKDAEIGYLKLEMDGVDNAKEEIGRLLGLTEEFRWKRISAAIHEQKRLIRELVVALTEFLEFGEYAYSHGREALAKAKAAGYSNEGKDNG